MREYLFQNIGRAPNVEITSAGAQVALGNHLFLPFLFIHLLTLLLTGLMYLKTNNQSVAARLNVPETHFMLERVRPDLLLMRVVCKSLVLWDSVSVCKRTRRKREEVAN